MTKRVTLIGPLGQRFQSAVYHCQSQIERDVNPCMLRDCWAARGFRLLGFGFPVDVVASIFPLRTRSHGSIVPSHA